MININKKNIYNIILITALFVFFGSIIFFKKRDNYKDQNLLEYKGSLINQEKKHVLAKLPYSYDALEPYIDAETMKIHYTKHYQAYADGLNKALEKHEELKEKSIEWLIENLDKLPEDIRTDVENFGGGYLNHTLFWFMMSPNSYKSPKGELKKGIEKYFKSFENFKNSFNEAAKKVFGSGWAWLCLDKEKKLVIINTKDQDNPLSKNYIPILGLDVWEHAYYIKYQNKRLDYIKAWWNVVNWPHIENLYIEALTKS